jgi:hypothetical protein
MCEAGILVLCLSVLVPGLRYLEQLPAGSAFGVISV